MITSSEKPWYLSRTILGGAAAVIAGLLGLSSEDAAEFTRLLTDFASLAGGALAIYGRVKATRAIALVPGTWG